MKKKTGSAFLAITPLEIALTFIMEGGNTMLMVEYLKTTEYSGFTSLGLDTIVARRFSLQPYITNEALWERLNDEEQKYWREHKNEKGETVTSILIEDIQMGADAIAAMLAYKRSLVKRDLDGQKLGRGGWWYWTSLYYNAGPTVGKQMLANNAYRSEDPYTGPLDRKYAAYNAMKRLASRELH